MKWLAVAVGVFVFAGCSGASPTPPVAKVGSRPYFQRTVYLDPNFSNHERSAIFEAMLAWTTATDGIVNWRYQDPPIPVGVLPWTRGGCSDVIVFTRAKSTDPRVVQYEKDSPSDPGNWVLGWTSARCSGNETVLIQDRIFYDRFRVVVEHEIGHQLGLGHLGKDSVMEAIGGKADCITKIDLDAFCQVIGCDRWAMKACR